MTTGSFKRSNGIPDRNHWLMHQSKIASSPYRFYFLHNSQRIMVGRRKQSQILHSPSSINGEQHNNGKGRWGNPRSVFFFMLPNTSILFPFCVWYVECIDNLSEMSVKIFAFDKGSNTRNISDTYTNLHILSSFSTMSTCNFNRQRKPSFSPIFSKHGKKTNIFLFPSSKIKAALFQWNARPRLWHTDQRKEQNVDRTGTASLLRFISDFENIVLCDGLNARDRIKWVRLFRGVTRRNLSQIRADHSVPFSIRSVVWILRFSWVKIQVYYLLFLRCFLIFDDTLFLDNRLRKPEEEEYIFLGG